MAHPENFLKHVDPYIGEQVLINDASCEISDTDEKPNNVKFTWRYADNRPIVRLSASQGIFTDPYNFVFYSLISCFAVSQVRYRPRLVHAIRSQIVYVVKDRPIIANRMRDLVNFIRYNPEIFPEWHRSATAKLFSPPKFENKKMAKGYWF